MATASRPASLPWVSSPVLIEAYRYFVRVGTLSVLGTLLYGFRFDAEAPAENYGWNLALFGLWVLPHLLMTRSWFKAALWGDPAGTPPERRFYVSLAIVTWLLLYALHWPVPGPALAVPGFLSFLGLLGFLYFYLRFFEGVDFTALDGMMAVPGSLTRFSHGPETPLFTDGPYSEVRHPMYRAAILAGLCTLLIHPNLGQLFWATLMGGTFIAFIPVEEAQLLSARRHEYQEYIARVPYRLFRGVW